MTALVVAVTLALNAMGMDCPVPQVCAIKGCPTQMRNASAPFAAVLAQAMRVMRQRLIDDVKDDPPRAEDMN